MSHKLERFRDNLKLIWGIKKERPPINWIEGMSQELKQKRIKIIWGRIIVYLILIPVMCFVPWYGIYKLVSYLIN
jgi:hypothetical protein